MSDRYGISMKKLAEIIRHRQDMRWDAIIIVDGPRGNGKSTFLYKLFCELEGFIPERDIVFSREDLIKSLKDKYGLIMQDEMINAGHNRDFYEKDQKVLIKMLNMYRDNFNILGGAVPFFYDLDPQIRKFVALRVTIYDRGKAILQKPGKSIYSNDPWDTDINRKLELNMRKLNRRGKVAKFNYTKLTTFWRTLKFGALSKKQEERYFKIKEDKRYQLMEADDEKVEKEMSEIEKLTYKYTQGLITKEDIEIYCRLQDKQLHQVMNSISKRKRSMGLMVMSQDSRVPLDSQAPQKMEN